MQTITLEMAVRPSHRDRLLTWLTARLPETRNAKGCRGIEAYASGRDPDRLTLIEQWDSTAEYEAYLEGRWRSGVLAELVGMLRADPVITYWTHHPTT